MNGKERAGGGVGEDGAREGLKTREQELVEGGTGREASKTGEEEWMEGRTKEDREGKLTGEERRVQGKTGEGREASTTVEEERMESRTKEDREGKQTGEKGRVQGGHGHRARPKTGKDGKRLKLKNRTMTARTEVVRRHGLERKENEGSGNLPETREWRQGKQKKKAETENRKQNNSWAEELM